MTYHASLFWQAGVAEASSIGGDSRAYWWVAGCACSPVVASTRAPARPTRPSAVNSARGSSVAAASQPRADGATATCREVWSALCARHAATPRPPSPGRAAAARCPLSSRQVRTTSQPPFLTSPHNRMMALRSQPTLNSVSLPHSCGIAGAQRPLLSPNTAQADAAAVRSALSAASANARLRASGLAGS